MTLKQPNRKRFIHAIDNAIHILQSEAQCYGYGCEKDYIDLMNYLKSYRKQTMYTGMLYELTLCDDFGLFQSGAAVLGNGTREPLIVQKTGEEKNYDGFMCQERSHSENKDFPLRWYHLYGEDCHEFAIYMWDDKIQQIMFTNNSEKDIVITLDEGKKLHLSPGQSGRITNPILI